MEIKTIFKLNKNRASVRDRLKKIFNCRFYFFVHCETIFMLSAIVPLRNCSWAPFDVSTKKTNVVFVYQKIY